MSSLQLNLLGSFSAFVDGHPIENPGIKSQALLIYLAVERERPQRRESLFTLLWPGMPEKSARHNLSQALYALRQVFPDGEDIRRNPIPLLLVDRQTVQLNPAAGVAVDILQLDALLKTTQTHTHPDLAACPTCNEALKGVFNLYQGDFLSDFYLEDSNAFEEWAETVRETYRRKLIETLATLADIATQNSDYEQAITFIDRQLAFDSLSERAQRQKIEVLAISGRRVEAIRQYRTFTQHLEEQLGATPSLETTALYERIRSEDLTIGHHPTETTTPKTTIPRHNLLPQPTPFIGRQEELTQLDEMLQNPDIRLITIVAPGGMGKTRLAVTCGERQLHLENAPYQHGVYFIPFAQVHEADRIVFTIAEAIHLQIESAFSQSPKEQLLHFLRRQHMLLLVDNFEHLIQHADLLTEILQNASGVKMLVTSRERLNIQLEHIFAISGLPSSDKEESPEVVVESPAAQLFIQSAQRFRPGFQILGCKDIESISLICHQVGGMPLALELAAGWVDLLSLANISAEIQGSLDFLETELQDVPERQRGIRAVFDSTWERLDQDERDVFLRFSIFNGGCMREAAHAVTGASLQTLASLAKKSLIQVRNIDDRYLIHELMRQYAAEKLSVDPVAEAAVQDAYCVYYCTALEKWEVELRSARQSSAVTAIQADYKNIQAAWDWAVEKMDLANLISAARGLSEYYEISLRFPDAEMVFFKATQKIQAIYGPEPEIPEAAWLLVYLLPQLYNRTDRSWLEYDKLSDKNTEKILHQSLALLRTPALAGMDTTQEEAFIHLKLGLKSNSEVNGRKHLKKSLNLYGELGDKATLAYVSIMTYWYFRKPGELPDALSEHLNQLRQSGDTARIARSLIQLGEIYRHDARNYKKARQLHQDAYAEARSGQNLVGMSQARLYAAWLCFFLGEFDLAKDYLEEGLEISYQVGNRYRAAIFLVEIGIAEAYRGQFLRANALMQEGLSSFPQTIAPPNDQSLPYAYLHLGKYEIVVKTAKTSTSVFTRAWVPVGWLALKDKRYSDALVDSQSILLSLQDNPEWYAWVQVLYGFALHGLGRTNEAKRELYQSLQYCVQDRAFLPLMHLMPILPVVLAASGDQAHQERALELYAMAKTLPFVANSKLFEDIAEKPLQEATEHLPQEVILAAQSRGRDLDWWQTAAVLLDELREFDWAGPSE